MEQMKEAPEFKSVKWEKVDINGQLAKYMLTRPEMVKSIFSVKDKE